MKIFRYLIVIIVITFFFLVGIYFYISRHFSPTLEGEIKLNGLRQPVTVVRDRYGIPRIKAQNRKDLFLAYGYVVAQDRLFQMDLLRRTGNGELSEIFGEGTLDVDKLLRNFKIKKMADKVWEKNKANYNPEIISLVDAFLVGVNQYIENNPLPLEFFILGYKPRPFTIQEMMSGPGFMALSFAGSLLVDPVMSDLEKKLSPVMLAPFRLYEKPLTHPLLTAEISVSKTLEKLFSYVPMFHGSNAWALSASRSETGFPLLANDPHIAFSSPSVWYEAHLSCPDYDVYGYFLPLVPFPVIGQTEDAAWTVTMSEVDDMDLYVEKLHPTNPELYSFEGVWLRFDRDKEIIKIKGQKDIEMSIRSTIHGPLLEGNSYEVQGKKVAVKWSYHHLENNALETFYQLPFVKTPQEFGKALSYAASPGLNMIWASKKGDIVQWVMGKIPRRKEEASSDHLLDGESGKDEYDGYLSIEENPHQINPASGQIVTTNYRPDGDHDLNGFWQPSDRQERVTSFLSSKEHWSVEEMKELQNDATSVSGDFIIPILLSSLDQRNPLEKEIFEFLSTWDKKAEVDSVGATIFHVWNQFNFVEILSGKLSAEEMKAMAKNNTWHFYKKMMKDESSPWWRGNRKLVLQAGLKKATTFLKNEIGGNPKKWTWGKIHTLTFEHPLGKVALLAPFFNLGPYPVSGATSVVNNMAHSRFGENFAVLLGPSTRRVIDLGHPQKFDTIIPTGNSGNIFSPHYADQVKLFLSGKFRHYDPFYREGPNKDLLFSP